MYQPKDVLERLAIPSPLDLEAFVSDIKSPQCTLENKVFCSISLPPFPWSFPQGGICRAGVDSIKFPFSRSACQSKWVRIGNSYASRRGDENCFSGLGVKPLVTNDDFASQQKIDELLRDLKPLTESITAPVDEPNVLDDSNLVKRSGASDSLDIKKPVILDEHVDVSDNHEEDDSMDYLFRQNSKSEASLMCPRNGSHVSSKYDSSSKGNEVGHEENDCSSCCGNHPSKSSIRDCGQCLWPLPLPEIPKAGNTLVSLSG